MLTIGIVPNLEKADCENVLKEFCALVAGRATLCVKDEKATGLADGLKLVEEKEFYTLSDVIVVMGGDGSILMEAPFAAAFNKPLLGINLGRLGYLAVAEKNSLEETVRKLLSGDYEIKDYMMLETKYKDSEGEEKTAVALNDVVVSRSQFGRIIEFTVYVDDEYVDTYTADGVVISTPTGSTAYSLSAGGPIAYPTMEMFLITPICAHGLNSRPIVIPADKKITVRMGNKYDYKAAVTVDGKIVAPLGKDSFISVCYGPVKTRLIKMNSRGFYDVLRAKLKGN